MSRDRIIGFITGGVLAGGLGWKAGGMAAEKAHQAELELYRADAEEMRRFRQRVVDAHISERMK